MLLEKLSVLLGTDQALGVNMEGHKELPGLWLSENEGAKFWLGVLTELKTGR